MARAKANASREPVPETKDPRELLAEYFRLERIKLAPKLFEVPLRETTVGPKLLALDRDTQAAVVELITSPILGTGDIKEWVQLTSRDAEFLERMLWIALNGLLARKLTLSEQTLIGLLRWVGSRQYRWEFTGFPLAGVTAVVMHFLAENPPSAPLLEALRSAVTELQRHLSDPACRKAAHQLSSAIPEDEPAIRVEPGEAWADALLADLGGMERTQRHAWLSLLASCQDAGGGTLKPKWIAAVRPRIEAVGRAEFRARVCRWFVLVDRPPAVHVPRDSPWEPDWDNLIRPAHVDLLKGLAWCAGFEADRELARALTALALSAYRKIPEIGARLPGLGNAAVAALSMMPGSDAVGQLAFLKLKVRNIPAQAQIAKALAAAAARENLPREELDELVVPTYGMEEVGHRREVCGDYSADLDVVGSDVTLHWTRVADGKRLTSVPAAAKKAHPDEVKELESAAKDAGKMLTAQRERIDGLFLARKRWPIDVWRERYLDHPLIGSIARRLIWHFEVDGQGIDGIWLDDRLVRADNQPIEALGQTATVELWHPLGRPLNEIAAWRDWLEHHQVCQPFKQAHREVYLLTDAENATRIYSNRFAGHILRQHQYHALCGSRGWRNHLRVMPENGLPASCKTMPEWGLRAEFWATGLGDDYQRDVTAAGAYLYVNTDQVRFYELEVNDEPAHAGDGPALAGNAGRDAGPLPLDRVPPLALSEIFREVDLFVSVANVGNDPNWADGGADAHFPDYFNTFAYGDLSVSGQTRKAVLERLIPRLKIASRCTFSDRFLIVRGNLRTYKIHLGSGNILMEPNDEYLCIVPGPRVGKPGDPRGLSLPFEGDETLSIILSKALLLADETQITDPTIIRQLTIRE